MAKKIFQKPRGTQDILPDDQKYWDFVTNTFISAALNNGYKRIITPTFEDTELFVRGIGLDTDIVEGEMYSFEDKSKNSITLKPEVTAPVVRAYLENGMSSWSQPVKLYYLDSVFRYERPQAGRYREFRQFGLETIGTASPLADVEMIIMAWRSFKGIGLNNLSLQLNSIGCSKCRPQYIRLLKSYFKRSQEALCDNCQIRLENNPLRLLDCKKKACVELGVEAPRLINSLCLECHDHFKIILEYLDDLSISYDLNTNLVRGLDYYTRTVFEIWFQMEGFGSQNAIGGGGRYDLLMEMLGGKPTPAVGFGAGIERIILALKLEGVNVSEYNLPKIYIAQLGEIARKQAFILAQEILSQGIPVVSHFDKGSVGEQLSEASEMKVPYALIIGQRETINKEVIIKDMYTGFQETLSRDKIVGEIIKRLM